MIYTYGDEHGGVELIDSWGDDKRAAHAARVSFAKDGRDSEITPNDIRLLRFMIREGHTSPFEHSGLTVAITCPLFVRGHIMRHRTFSFNEVSRRYTSESLKMYVPEELRKQSDKNLQCSLKDTHVVNESYAINLVKDCADNALTVYNYLLKKGTSREQARGVLPQNTYTSFWMTGNLHNWYKFLKLRLHGSTQPETQVIAKAVLDIVEDKFPITTMLISEETNVLPLSVRDLSSSSSQEQSEPQELKEDKPTPLDTSLSKD